MKYLKIDDHKGHYFDGNEYKEIDKINKDDLLKLLGFAKNADFELDPYNEDLLANRAHQIIYENIYNKFAQFLEDKDQFKREVDQLYKGAIDKYAVEINESESYEEVEDDGEEELKDKEADEIDIKDIPF